MRRTALLFLFSLLMAVGTQAQQIVKGKSVQAQQIVNRTREALGSSKKYVNGKFQDVSLSEALLQLNTLQSVYTVNFIYNELEDFRVSTTVTRKPVAEAIQQLIGFYPVRMTVNDEAKEIYVECIHKTDRHLTGRIIDEQGQSVAYANVALLNPADSTLLSGGVSNESGVFVIPYEQPQVLARISFVGYKTIYKLCSSEDAGTVRMERDTYMLKAVKVNGERQIVKAENGHLIYNMPRLLEVIPADNAYEALTRIPGVTDTGNGLSFTGRGVTLIINGKPTTLSAGQVIERLKQMPATMLAKAEVLPSAPARYHVRGMAINVITKDFAGTHQMTGQLQGTWKQSRYGLGYVKGSMMMQQGKFGLDASYGFTDGSNYGQVEHEAHHLLSGQRKDYADRTKRKSTGVNHDYHIGMDYAFAEDHRLNLAYTGQWTSDDATNISTGVESSVQKSTLHDYLHNVDANYEAPFGLELGISYTNYQNPRTQHLDGKMYDETRQLTVDSRQRISKWMFTADQTHGLHHGWELNYGMKAQFTANESYQTTLDPAGQRIPDATTHVDYDERILNGYVGFSKQFSPSFSLEGSVTAEQYHAPKWNKWHLYPMFSLMWNVNRQNMLNLSFASDAVYPSYWSTMSSIYYSSAYSEIWGNPDLKPSSIYNLNLTWQHRQRYSFGMFTSLQPDYAVQLPYQPSDRMAVIMKETNFDYSNLVGLFASVRFNAGQWLNGTVNATALYRHDKSDQFFDLPFDRTRIAAILSGTLSAKLLKKENLMLVLTPFFQSKAIQGVYDIDPRFILNAQLRWTSNNGKWSIIAAGNNIFNGYFTTHSIQGNQDFAMRVWMEYANGSLTAIHRIGSFKEKKHKQVDTSRMGY